MKTLLDLIKQEDLFIKKCRYYIYTKDIHVSNIEQYKKYCNVIFTKKELCLIKSFGSSYDYNFCKLSIAKRKECVKSFKKIKHNQYYIKDYDFTTSKLIFNAIKSKYSKVTNLFDMNNTYDQKRLLKMTYIYAAGINKQPDSIFIVNNDNFSDIYNDIKYNIIVNKQNAYINYIAFFDKTIIFLEKQIVENNSVINFSKNMFKSKVLIDFLYNGKYKNMPIEIINSKILE